MVESTATKEYTHDNVIKVDFRREEKEEPTPEAIKVANPLSEYTEQKANCPTTLALQNYNHYIDPDMLVLMDNPDMAFIIEGILATLEVGETFCFGESYPLKVISFNFNGNHFVGVSEQMDTKTCLFLKKRDCLSLINLVNEYLIHRGFQEASEGL